MTAPKTITDRWADTIRELETCVAAAALVQDTESQAVFGAAAHALEQASHHLNNTTDDQVRTGGPF